MGSTEEPERKRRHLHDHTASPPLKKQPMAPSSDEKKVDAQVLQYQNQKLAQQLDVQRTEIHALETRFNQLKTKQVSYDETLICVNRVWNQLVDDLELLTVRANATCNGIRLLEGSVSSKERAPTHPPEHTFLHRLLETGATESSTSADNSSSIDGALNVRKASTVKTMKFLVQAIDVQRSKNEELASLLRERLPSDEAGRHLQRVDEELRAEILTLRANMDALHLKHKEIAAEIGVCRDARAKDQSEIARLTGELEETATDLETSRRKLASLRNQKDVVVGPPTPGPVPGTKSDHSEKGGSEKATKEAKELEFALEEAKSLAARRLTELQDSLQTQLNLSQKLQHMQDLLGEEQRILSSRPYQLLNEQVQHARSESERLRTANEELRKDRDTAVLHEKEIFHKLEIAEGARRVSAVAESRIGELEGQLQQCMAERDNLQLRLEEKVHAQGRKDSVSELKVMVTTLHKEMSMMQAQLTKYKEAALEVHSLRAETHSLASILQRKTSEYKKLSEQYAAQIRELASLKDDVQSLQDSEQELKLILDMYGRESSDPRNVIELQQAESRAWAQVERLKTALDEHNLELRVKAANEAEAACQQRLTAAEADIAELRQQLDDSDRVAMELKESLKAKNEEGEAYISEIETIGQAYEDMQTQNQRLLQQLTERDDYNTQLVAESLKAKQAQANLQAEKLLLVSRMQHVSATSDAQKQRLVRLEEQVRTYMDQLAKAIDESRLYSSQLESAKRKTSEVEKEVSSTKLALEAAQKTAEERGHKISEIQGELEKERFEKRRIQEELDAATTKISRLGSHPDASPMIERLQEEIKEYRAYLKCSVCHDRAKEVVITKCYHLFCGPCIQRNLELRHRKCPGCGVPFGQNDVRTVYI
ncbi:unnamed protein product [Calypogeia fissa]